MCLQDKSRCLFVSDGSTHVKTLLIDGHGCFDLPIRRTALLAKDVLLKHGKDVSLMVKSG